MCSCNPCEVRVLVGGAPRKVLSAQPWGCSSPPLLWREIRDAGGHGWRVGGCTCRGQSWLVPGMLGVRAASRLPVTSSPCLHFLAERDAFDTLFDHAPDKLTVVKKVRGGRGLCPPLGSLGLCSRPPCLPTQLAAAPAPACGERVGKYRNSERLALV